MINEYCHGEAGPPSAVTFEVDNNVSFTVSTAKAVVAPAFFARVKINLPPGSTIQFMSDDIHLLTRPNDTGTHIDATLHTAALVSFNSNEVVDISQAGPLTAQATASLRQAHPMQPLMTTHIDYEIGDQSFHPDRMAIELPSIAVNGTVIALPQQTLASNLRDKGWQRYETEERKQLRKARYEVCRNTTPQMHCENILTVINDSFRIESSAFEAYGNLARADFTQNPVLTGRINVEFKDLNRWQFNSNTIRLKDMITGDSRQSIFNQFTVFFGWYDNIPFTSAVKGVHHTSTGNTTVLIKLRPVLNMPSTFRVQLPPLRINGHEYLLKPIQFELKSFDGGIEPFNC